MFSSGPLKGKVICSHGELQDPTIVNNEADAKVLQDCIEVNAKAAETYIHFPCSNLNESVNNLIHRSSMKINFEPTSYIGKADSAISSQNDGARTVASSVFKAMNLTLSGRQREVLGKREKKNEKQRQKNATPAGKERRRLSKAKWTVSDVKKHSTFLYKETFAIKCRCKGGCTTKRCACRKARQPCGSACGHQCLNPFTAIEHSNEIGDHADHAGHADHAETVDTEPNVDTEPKVVNPESEEAEGPPRKKRRLAVVFDTETEGLAPQWHRPIQLASVFIPLEDDTLESTSSQFSTYAKPGRKLSEKVEKLTGILSPEKVGSPLAHAPPLKDAILNGSRRSRTPKRDVMPTRWFWWATILISTRG